MPMNAEDTETRPIRLAFVGDIGINRRVPAMLRSGLGTDPPPPYVTQLRGADIAFANLEIPFCRAADVDDDPDVKTRAQVEDAPLLRDLGFDLVTLANNHVTDGGPEALQLTRDTLDELGISWFGAGDDLEDAVRPVVIEKQGVKIGFVGFVEGRAHTHPHIVHRDQPGAAPLDHELIRKTVTALRPQVDLLCVSLHQGVNYVSYASPRQREFVRTAVDSGADLIIGHHPHVLQGWERIDKALVFYSLGEFLFDPDVGNVVDPRWDKARRQTGLLEVDYLPGQPLSFTFSPYRREENFLIRPLEGAAADRFHQWFDEISRVYENYDPSLYLEAASQGVTQHALKVLLYNLRRGNIRYLLGALSRLRGRHLRIAWAHFTKRFARSTRSSGSG